MNDMPSLQGAIRVLVVDDSAFMRTALSRMIACEHGLEVIGTAGSGSGALEKIPVLDPDVITLDVNMPGLDGLETLRRIMQRFPRPVIMVSSITEKDAETTFTALGAGAFDYVPKQLSPSSLEIDHIRSDLIAKIWAAGAARRSRSRDPRAKKPSRTARPEDPPKIFSACSIVALGTSTGGPKALETILPLLPRDLAVPILIVQHMPIGFTTSFARRLSQLCSISVHEATDGEVLRSAVAYIAPAGVHLRVRRRTSDGKIISSLGPDPLAALHIPSIDVLMKSVAEIYRDHALGIILTGMGSDGVEGMSAIYRSGGFTIGQDEATCAVASMPRSCAKLGILRRIVPLADIPAQIVEATRQRKLA
jgi:two-component system chemotaxis response regulator CheB